MSSRHLSGPTIMNNRIIHQTNASNMKKSVRIILALLICSLFFSCQNYKYRDMELYPIMENGLYGFIDTLGNKVVVPQYICVSNFGNHLAAAVVDTFYAYHPDSAMHKLGLGYAEEVPVEHFLYVRYGYINIENEFVISPNLVRRFKVEGKQIFSNSDLENLSAALSFHEGLAAYQDSITFKYGFVDTLGHKKIRALYYNYEDFSSEKAAVQIFNCNKDEPVTDDCFKWGYIGKDGERKSDFVYWKLSSCVNGRSFGAMWSMAKDQEKHTVIRQNENGELEFNDPDLDDSMPIQSMVTVLLDENGKIIKNDLPSIYYYYNYTDDGVAVAEREGAEVLGPDLKFLDRDGKYLEPHDVNNSKPMYIGMVPDEYHFSDVTAMSEGYAGIMGNDGKWIFVDKNLNIYAPINDTAYDDVKVFHNGLVGVCQNGKWGYLDQDFNVVIPLKYDWVGNAGKHLMKVALIDNDSHIVIESYINRRDSVVWQRVDNRNK